MITDNPRMEVVQDDFSDYAEFPAVNHTVLRLADPHVGGAPVKGRHYMRQTHQVECDAGELEGVEKERESDALQFGHLYHWKVLEPAEFVAKTAMLDPERKTELFEAAKEEGSKARGFSKQLATYRKWKADQEADGRVIVDEGQLSRLEAMERALRADAACGALLKPGGRGEVSLYFGLALNPRDPNCQKKVQCKARVDYLTMTGIVDLKTVRDGSPEGFAKAVPNYGYDTQAAWYLYGAQLLGLGDDLDYHFVVQEKTGPYAAAAYALPESWLKYARINVLAMFSRFRECLRTNEWPSYGGGELLPPMWLEQIIEQVA